MNIQISAQIALVTLIILVIILIVWRRIATKAHRERLRALRNATPGRHTIPSKTEHMKILKYIWTIAVNLIVLSIIIAMFGRVAGSFETIVVAGLVLIYVSLTSSITILGRAFLESHQANYNQFIRLATLLEDTEIESYNEELQEFSELFQKQQIRFYINVAFNFLIWIFAIWKIIQVL